MSSAGVQRHACCGRRRWTGCVPDSRIATGDDIVAPPDLDLGADNACLHAAAPFAEKGVARGDNVALPPDPGRVPPLDIDRHPINPGKEGVATVYDLVAPFDANVGAAGKIPTRADRSRRMRIAMTTMFPHQPTRMFMRQQIRRQPIHRGGDASASYDGFVASPEADAGTAARSATSVSVRAECASLWRRYGCPCRRGSRCG